MTKKDPRNDEDYDTWEYGTEPIPKDRTWKDVTNSPEDWEDFWYNEDSK